jgi:hypothetical protein
VFRMRADRWPMEQFARTFGLIGLALKTVPYFAIQVYVLSAGRWNVTSQLSILASSVLLLKSVTTWLIVRCFLSSVDDGHYKAAP